MTTSTGKCLFVQKDETAIFKIIGSLRFNTSSGLSAKIEGLQSMPHIKDIVVDMSETQYVDSTILGLIAQLAKRDVPPIVLYESENIYQMLRHLGLHKVFLLSKKTPVLPALMEDDLQEIIPIESDSEEKLRKRIEKAHQLLYEIDEKNKIEFGEVVNYIVKQND